MPSSRPYGLTYICQRIIDLQPRSVLDIGFGFGKMGFLAREYTDVWNERFYSGGWNRTRIDGIEAYAPYITELQRQIYDNIYVGEAIEVMKNPRLFFPDKPYELTLCCDMLEHLSEEDGFQLLELIKTFSKRAIVTTPDPSVFTKQGAVYGNDYERHLHCWTPSALAIHGRVLSAGDNKMSILEIGF
jgi:hypothetical protein